MYKYVVIDNRICIFKSLALNASLTFRLVAWWPQNFCTALPPPPTGGCRTPSCHQDELSSVRIFSCILLKRCWAYPVSIACLEREKHVRSVETSWICSPNKEQQNWNQHVNTHPIHTHRCAPARTCSKKTINIQLKRAWEYCPRIPSIGLSCSFSHIFIHFS